MQVISQAEASESRRLRDFAASKVPPALKALWAEAKQAVLSRTRPVHPTKKQHKVKVQTSQALVRKLCVDNDLQVANAFKERAKVQYEKQDYVAAYGTYSICIESMRIGKECCASLLWNRARCLIKLGRFAKAYVDLTTLISSKKWCNGMMALHYLKHIRAGLMDDELPEGITAELESSVTFAFTAVNDNLIEASHCIKRLRSAIQSCPSGTERYDDLVAEFSNILFFFSNALIFLCRHYESFTDAFREHTCDTFFSLCR